MAMGEIYRDTHTVSIDGYVLEHGRGRNFINPNVRGNGHVLYGLRKLIGALVAYQEDEAYPPAWRAHAARRADELVAIHDREMY